MDSKELYDGTDYTPSICDEESFGTGLNRVHEMDVIWAVLAWMSILASKNTDSIKPLVTIEVVVQEHWAKYGRSYYCRWDFEGMESKGTNTMVDKMRAETVITNTGRTVNCYPISTADDFTYVNPVDGSVT
jgi:phosphoglucomutase